jgi:hypothetical protein
VRALALGVLVLALAGCTLFTGPTDGQLARADATGEKIAALDGVADAWASYNVGFDVGDDLRVSVTPDEGSTPVQILELVPRINALIDDAGFDGSARSVTITLDDDAELYYYASRDKPFDVEAEVATYLKWWADPRVAAVENTNLFWVTLEPGESVRDVYGEIIEDPTVLETSRTIRVADPSGYQVNADRADYDRFDAADEIAALPSLTECSFAVSQPGEGPIGYDVSCHGPADLGPAINDILGRYGQLADTEVQIFDGSWVTTNP